MLAREQQRLAEVPFEIGQHLAHSLPGRSSATILRRFETDEGMQYLLNEKGRCYWQPHDAIRKSWKAVSGEPQDVAPAPKTRPLSSPIWGEGREVSAYMDGERCDGKILFYEGRSQPPTWAVEYQSPDQPGETVVRLFIGNQLRERPISADMFPVGSKVHMKWGRETRDAVVRDFDERRGIQLEINTGRRSFTQWINSRRMIDQYELKLVDAVQAPSSKDETAAPPANDRPRPSR